MKAATRMKQASVTSPSTSQPFFFGAAWNLAVVVVGDSGGGVGVVLVAQPVVGAV